jgi:hypothetical protein
LILCLHAAEGSHPACCLVRERRVAWIASPWGGRFFRLATDSKYYSGARHFGRFTQIRKIGQKTRRLCNGLGQIGQDHLSRTRSMPT